MPREISSANQDALEAGSLVLRDFLTIVARDRDTGDQVSDGMWSDVGTVTAEVVDPDTGLADERTFYGAGTLISIDDIPLVSNLTVQTVTIRLSQVADRVNDLVRTHDCKQARVEIHRGLFDPATRLPAAPAVCRFVGFVDDIEIQTPAEGGDGGVTLSCVSHTQEMTRSNPDTRSHASQVLRSASDDFFADAATVGEWELWWGKRKGRVA